MLALPELQAAFYAAILAGGPTEDALLPHLTDHGAQARQRIAAYRRSIIGNQISALQATYPVLARIVGLPFFRAAAGTYVRNHPSDSGDLNEYGADFADFIGSWPPARELGYLSDVARLEWQVQAVYYAADPRVDLSVIGRSRPEDYGCLRFERSPASARLDSPWPLDRIWHVNGEDYVGDMGVDFSRGARLLLLRRNGRVHVESLAAAEAAFLDALAEDTLASAADAAVAATDDANVPAMLARFVGDGTLTRAWLEDAS